MNDKIFELAEEAGGIIKHVPPVWQFFDDELEKFAESIIMKCCELIEDHYEPVYDGKILKDYFGIDK